MFWPGESHGQRSLAGYSPWDHQASDTTEETQHTHKGGYRHSAEFECLVMVSRGHVVSGRKCGKLEGQQ